MELARKLKDLISLLPIANRSVLQYLIEFLALVASHNAKNQMNKSNISRIWGPIFLQSKEADPNTVVKESLISNEIVTWLIDFKDKIFENNLLIHPKTN